MGYDYNGIGRWAILALMLCGVLLCGAAQVAFTLLPESVARPIDYHRDVLRMR